MATASALAESQLRYGDVVWGSLSRTKLAALQRLQTQALKIIRKAKIKDTWSCPGMNVEKIVCFDRNVMTYKIIHKLFPNSFLEKYKPRSSFSSYNTRNSQNLQIPKHKKAFITQLLRNGIIRLETYVSCQQ